MGLLNSLKKKFDRTTADKNVKNVVVEKKAKKEKASVKESGLSKDDIKRAQDIEAGQGKDKPAEETKKEKKQEKRGPRDAKFAYKVLVRPIFTEKVALLQTQNKVVFEVNTNATKSEIIKAVKAAYDVQPVAVHIQRVRGKAITYGRVTGSTKKRKKAIVTLPAGKTIGIYES